jgi:hypothetical protein
MKADKIWNRDVKPFSGSSTPLAMHEGVQRMEREIQRCKKRFLNVRRFIYRAGILVCDILPWSAVTAFYTNPHLLYSHWCNIIKLVAL